jgi:flagellar basal-body rod protein FlgB
MFLADVVNRGTVPGLEKLLAFTEARHQVLAENIANADTPGYKTKHLDPKAFQAALGEAFDNRRTSGSAEFEVASGEQFRFDNLGRLTVEPSTDPAENILFHDGTNMQIDRQMSYLAENAMMHQVLSELLRGRFDGLMTAIRGRVG